jgi:hypothetical protein
MQSVKPKWYIESYGEFLRSSQFGSVMPYIGEMVTVIHKDKSQTSGEFLGIGMNNNNEYHNSAVPMPDALAKVKNHYLALKNNGSNPKVYLPDVKMLVVQRGDVVKGSTIRQMVRMDEVPLMSCLAMKTAEGTIMFQLDQVESVRVIEKKSGGKKVGLVVGAIIDGLVVIAGTAALIYFFDNFELFPNGICIKDCGMTPDIEYDYDFTGS